MEDSQNLISMTYQKGNSNFVVMIDNACTVADFIKRVQLNHQTETLYIDGDPITKKSNKLKQCIVKYKTIQIMSKFDPMDSENTPHKATPEFVANQMEQMQVKTAIVLTAEARAQLVYNALNRTLLGLNRFVNEKDMPAESNIALNLTLLVATMREFKKEVHSDFYEKTQLNALQHFFCFLADYEKFSSEPLFAKFCIQGFKSLLGMFEVIEPSYRETKAYKQLPPVDRNDLIYRAWASVNEAIAALVKFMQEKKKAEIPQQKEASDDMLEKGFLVFESCTKAIQIDEQTQKVLQQFRSLLQVTDLK